MRRQVLSSREDQCYMLWREEIDKCHADAGRRGGHLRAGATAPGVKPSPAELCFHGNFLGRFRQSLKTPKLRNQARRVR